MTFMRRGMLEGLIGDDEAKGLQWLVRKDAEKKA